VCSTVGWSAVEVLSTGCEYLEVLLKSQVDYIIRKICGSLDVNTKILLFRYILFFSTKYKLFTSYTYRIGEKSVNTFAQKTIVLLCKCSKLIEVR
jgi:hypothetical protein